MPSPKFQVHANVPVPPVGLAVKATAMPASVGLGEAVGVPTVGDACTVTLTLFDALPPAASVAVTVAVKLPAVV
jgi:hypothetical protein